MFEVVTQCADKLAMTNMTTDHSNINFYTICVVYFKLFVFESHSSLIQGHCS